KLEFPDENLRAAGGCREALLIRRHRQVGESRSGYGKLHTHLIAFDISDLQDVAIDAFDEVLSIVQSSEMIYPAASALQVEHGLPVEIPRQRHHRRAGQQSGLIRRETYRPCR